MSTDKKMKANAARGQQNATPSLGASNLLKVPLAANDDLEIVVSHVEVPGDFEAPMHYHPGEEFAYVVSGSVTLKVAGQADATFNAGDACVVPSRALHTVAASEPATLVVFRVHEKDAPVRVIVKSDGEEVPLNQ